MISTMIHGVKFIGMTQTVCSQITSGTYYRRKLIVIDENGHRIEITLFANSEESMEIKEITL